MATSKSELKPLRDHLAVRPDKVSDTTEGGIIIPSSSSKEAPSFGTVVCVGPLVDGVKSGDRVLFRKYAGDEVKHDGETLLMVQEADVMAVAE